MRGCRTSSQPMIHQSLVRARVTKWPRHFSHSMTIVQFVCEQNRHRNAVHHSTDVSTAWSRRRSARRKNGKEQLANICCASLFDPLICMCNMRHWIWYRSRDFYFVRDKCERRTSAKKRRVWKLDHTGGVEKIMFGINERQWILVKRATMLITKRAGVW